MSISDQLTNLELKIIPVLLKNKDSEFLVDKIVSETNLKDIEVMRAIQWLSNKNLVTIREEVKELLDLDSNGKEYSKTGLPEIKLLKLIEHENKSISSLQEKGLSSEEISISIGQLKKNMSVNLSKDSKTNELIFSITENGKKNLLKESLEQKFLKRIFPCELNNLLPEEKFAFDSLSKRKQIVKLDIRKIVSVKLTKEGKEISLEDINAGERIEKLTPEMIKSQSYRGKIFRSFDVSSPVPKEYFGKKHFVNDAIDYVKKIFLEMGFSEMKGSMVQSSFWDLDSLFVPQDHPAREMQDTFYIKDPKDGNIPKEFIDKIRKVHEEGMRGLDIKSKDTRGWGGKFSEDVSKKNLLRTHTTVVSAQMISQLKEKDLPAKFFSVDKVYRNEALDQKHLFEFHQVEGIVIDPDANFSNLLGYLKEFFKKMGYDDVRIRPAHFPYTEPSAEIEVYVKELDTWIELGGSGIFRPEVVVPLLGRDVPVLAWGLGLERIIVPYFGFRDIRLLYNNDFKVLRSAKKWMM